MNWLSDLTRPRIATRKARDVNASVWEKCPACGEMLYTKDLAANQRVCTSCGHHLRLPLDTRLHLLLDENSQQTLNIPPVTDDPLTFRDTKLYSQRLAAARKKTGQQDGVRVVYGTIDQHPVIIIALDFAFMGGSMGRAVGQAFQVAVQAAQAYNCGVLCIPASGGARMQEGLFSLMQMAHTTAQIQTLKDNRLPYICLLTDPTTGGVTASFAMLGDIMLAEPGALIGFAGPRVIQQTTGETLPDGFQTAEFLHKHGMLDQVVPRGQQRKVLARCLKLLNPRQC